MGQAASEDTSGGQDDEQQRYKDVRKTTLRQPFDVARDDVYYLTGAVEADTDRRYIRLYPRPLNKRDYLLIAVADIVDERTLKEPKGGPVVFQYSRKETRKAGIDGEDVYRVALFAGTEVHAVTIQRHELGEDLFAPSYPLPHPPRDGDCLEETCREYDCIEFRRGRWECSDCCGGPPLEDETCEPEPKKSAGGGCC